MPVAQDNPYRFAILLGLLTFVFLGAADIKDFARVLGDPDTFWHVRLGNDILSSGHFPTTDTYSFSFADKPFVSKEWLSEVLLASAYRIWNWNGVLFLTVLASLTSIMLLFRELARYLHPTFAGLIAIAMSPMINPVVLSRPHIFTMAIAVYFTARMFRAAEAKQSPPYWALALVVLWANLHGSFTLSFVIAGFAFLHLLENVRLTDKPLLIKWIVFLVLCPVAALIHPYTYQPMTIGINMMATNKAMAYISEWMPLNAKDDFLIEYFALAVLALLVGARLKIGWAKTLFIVFMLHMLLTHARFVYVFFLLVPIVVVPELAVRFGQISLGTWRNLPRDVMERFGMKWFRLASTILCLGAVVAAFLFIRESNTAPPEDTAAEKPIAYALANHIEGNVFNEYRYGGTLIFHGIKTFIDGRAEQLFTGDFFPEYVNSGKHDGAKLFKELLDRHKINWTLLPADDLRNGYLDQLGWKKTYSDDKAMIYTKPAA